MTVPAYGKVTLKLDYAPVSGKDADLVFDGEGFVDGRSYLGSNGQQWKTIAFRKGSYKCNGSGYDKIYGTNLWLGVDVALTAGSGSYPNAIQNSPSVYLSEGATILVSTETVSGIFGTGTVLGTGSYKVTVNLSFGASPTYASSSLMSGFPARNDARRRSR